MQMIDQERYLGFFPVLAVVSALGVLLVSFSFDMSQFGDLALESLFLPGLLLIYVPCLVRLMSAAPLRLERICLLCLVGICFFLVQLMVSPTYISSYDAMLHWMTSDTLRRTQHLFGVNSLLPVSPYYPGLEIVTNALSSISSLNIFQAGTLVIAVARLLMILSLYMFYELVTMSGRVAGIAVMLYMTNPHFLFFDAIFSYETLALPIALFILYVLARYDAMGVGVTFLRNVTPPPHAHTGRSFPQTNSHAPAAGGHKGPHPTSTPLPPLRDTRFQAVSKKPTRVRPPHDARKGRRYYTRCWLAPARKEDHRTSEAKYRWMLSVAWLALGALTITHHMTDYVFDGFLVLWTIVSLLHISGRGMRRSLAGLALAAILFSLAYAFLMAGNPVWQYLSSYFKTAFGELQRIVAGAGTARQLFVSHGAAPAPPWDRLLMLGSVGVIMLGLPFGLFRLWRQRRHNVLAMTLGLAALGYPLTQVFRFTNYGAEITDRAAAFLFIPLAYVLAMLITPAARGWSYIAETTLAGVRTTLITCAMAVMLLGGALLESGPVYSALPGPYTVIADGRSIEPIGIQAAQWSLSHLGPDNRVATDRINQVVFGTFGEQRIVSEQEDKVSIAPIFLSAHFDQQTLEILRTARIRYLVVDLRLSTSLPLLGFYFETDEPGAFHLNSPLRREDLTKFSALPQVNQVFDDGSILIYDVSTLTDDVSQDSALAVPSNQLPQPSKTDDGEQIKQVSQEGCSGGIDDASPLGRRTGVINAATTSCVSVSRRIC